MSNRAQRRHPPRLNSRADTRRAIATLRRAAEGAAAADPESEPTIRYACVTAYGKLGTLAATSDDYSGFAPGVGTGVESMLARHLDYERWKREGSPA